MASQFSQSALKQFGQTIQRLRKYQNLTQEQLGELCDRHPVYISELERGVKSPSLDSILRLSEALKVTSGDLMNLAFQPENDKQSYKREITVLLEQQNSEDLRRIIRIIKAYADER